MEVTSLVTCHRPATGAGGNGGNHGSGGNDIDRDVVK